jgi:hypothetical protein
MALSYSEQLQLTLRQGLNWAFVGRRRVRLQ